MGRPLSNFRASLDFGGYPDLSDVPYGVEQRLQIFLIEIEAVNTRPTIHPEGPGLAAQGGQHVRTRTGRFRGRLAQSAYPRMTRE